MKTAARDQSGFSLIEPLLVLVALAIVGFVGYYVYQANNKTLDTYNAAGASSNSSVIKSKDSPNSADKSTTNTSTGAISDPKLKAAAEAANPNDPQSTSDMNQASGSLNTY